MPSIDLVILGMALEQPRSAYDIQKDVEGHHFSRWTRVSAPSIYRKTLQLQAQGYLHSETVRGERRGDKAVYSITEKGRAYFEQLMEEAAEGSVPLRFDFNVMIANLNKLEPERALELLGRFRDSLTASAQAAESFAAQYADIPLTGRTIFEQQRLLYQALLAWLDGFEGQLRES